MRIAGLKLNDCIDGEGISVSLWTQGCPHRCLGCHNPETWDFEGGYEEWLQGEKQRVSQMDTAEYAEYLEEIYGIECEMVEESYTFSYTPES